MKPLISNLFMLTVVGLSFAFSQDTTQVENKKELICSENITLNNNTKNIHQYLIDSGKIINIHNFDKSLLHIFPRKVIELIKEGNNEWETMVPQFVAKTIKSRRMFEYYNTK